MDLFNSSAYHPADWPPSKIFLTGYLDWYFDWKHKQENLQNSYFPFQVPKTVGPTSLGAPSPLAGAEPAHFSISVSQKHKIVSRKKMSFESIWERCGRYFYSLFPSCLPRPMYKLEEFDIASSLLLVLAEKGVGWSDSKDVFPKVYFPEVYFWA